MLKPTLHVSRNESHDSLLFPQHTFSPRAPLPAQIESGDMTYRLPRGVNVSNPESKAVAVLLLREEATASTRDEDPRHAQDPGLCRHRCAFSDVQLRKR